MTDWPERKRTELLVATHNKVLALLTRGAPLSEVLETTCRLIEELAPGVMCSILLLESDKLRHGAAPSLPQDYNQLIDGLQIGPTAGSCGTAAYLKKTVIVSDTFTDPLWASYRDVAQRYGLRACWSTPILSQQGEVLGMFAMYYREPRLPSPYELRLIEQTAHLLALVLERWRITEALHRREQVLHAVARIAERLLSASLWGECAPEVLQELGQATYVSRVYIFENHHSETGALLTRQRFEWVSEGISPQIGNPDLQNFDYVANGFGRWVELLSRGEPIFGLVRDLSPSERSVLEAQQIKSIVCVPIFVKGAWWGFIGFDECTSERVWSVLEIDALKVAANILGAAIERAASQELLHASERRYRELFENANDGIYILDRTGHILSFNRKAEEITGYTLDEVRGQLSTLFVPAGPERKKARRAFIKNLRGHPDKNELTITRKDGRHVIVELSTRPIWQAGQIVGIQGIGRDVTERKELERLKSDFISTVSHELRTPLTSIKGYVDLVLAGDVGPLTPEQKEFLTIVSQNTTRLAELINDLLEIERLESGRIEFEFAELDLAEALQSVARSLHINAEQKGLELLTEIASGLKVRGDRERLAQVFLNLLSNAIKYTPAGTVELKAYRENDSVVVAVRDTGIGLSESDMRKLFQRFFRADNPYVRKAGGTGLGLSIAKAIVECHGGTITVTSQLGQGSTFTVRLPAVALPEAERPLVLIIEDEVAIARLIATHLEKMGCRAVTAYLAREGFDQAICLQPRLIILDVLMPDLDGFALVQQLKKHPETAHIPVIFLSIVRDRQQGLRLGASAFLTKPIDERKLYETVRMLLEGQGKL